MSAALPLGGVGILSLFRRGDTMCLDSIPSGIGFSISFEWNLLPSVYAIPTPIPTNLRGE